MTFFWAALFLFGVNALLAIEVLGQIHRVKRMNPISQRYARMIVRRLTIVMVMFIVFTVVCAYIAALYFHKVEALKWTVS